MTELSPPDARAWLGLATVAAPAVERWLGPEVLGNRWDLSWGAVRPFRPALRRARGIGARLAATAEALVRTDVRDCYGSIRPEALEGSLRRAGVDGETALGAARVVGTWNALGVPGLPVGPQPSALFANAVLGSADAVLRRAGVRFARWVDDLLIDPGRRGPSDVLAILDEAWTTVGLTRAVHKTSFGMGEPSALWGGYAGMNDA
jgi:hypothetical protein